VVGVRRFIEVKRTVLNIGLRMASLKEVRFLQFRRSIAELQILHILSSGFIPGSNNILFPAFI